jgi:hypothetical protein
MRDKPLYDSYEMIFTVKPEFNRLTYCGIFMAWVYHNKESCQRFAFRRVTAFVYL